MEYGDEIEPPEDDGDPEVDTIAGTYHYRKLATKSGNLTVGQVI